MALTKRQQLVLAALASRPASNFAPVQVQKLFFLIDENIADQIGGKQFSFEPYDYGPFDKTVYQELRTLEHHGLVHTLEEEGMPSRRRYSLTPAGQEAGEAALMELSEKARTFMANVTNWIYGLSFAQLVGSIYKAYPRMREKSIFVEQ